MKKYADPILKAVLTAIGGGLIVLFLYGTFLNIKNSFYTPSRPPRLNEWSRWSEPVDTTPLGFWHREGMVQYRTNNFTGLIEARSIK